jgi:hypothetical protein
VARFNEQIESIQWDEIVFSNGTQPRRVLLPEVSVNDRLEALNAAARDGRNFDEFISAVEKST